MPLSEEQVQLLLAISIHFAVRTFYAKTFEVLFLQLDFSLLQFEPFDIPLYSFLLDSNSAFSKRPILRVSICISVEFLHGQGVIMVHDIHEAGSES